jgi:signal transduction histidine kinase
MSLRSLKRARHTLWLRLTAWYTGFFLLSAMVLSGVAYVKLWEVMQRYDREAIEIELDEYLAAYHRGGVEAVATRAASAHTPAMPTLFFVGVARDDQPPLFLHHPAQWRAFDLDQLTRELPRDTIRWTVLSARQGGVVLDMASVGLPDGAVLHVGKSMAERQALWGQFRRLSATILLVAVGLGVGGGAVLARRTLQPLRSLLALLRSVIATGNLTARAPTRDTGNELDELSRLFNGMLDKIGQLIAGMRNALDAVAHDLRTPMTRLRSMTELALRSAVHEEQLREALATGLEESERILALLNTLMDISEAETGVMQLALTRLQVADLLAQVVNLYGDVLEDKGLTVTRTASPHLYITADRNRMLQVLANLLDNAVKYTPSGGCIDMAATPHGPRQVLITVTDTGIGIPPDDLPNIWDRLYRGDSSRSQRGLGLGLSLVKAIVEVHRGTVTVSSTVGHGARFALVLPV